MKIKLYAITNNPIAQTGLALVGISSRQAHTQEELQQALECVALETGIVIITSGLAEKYPDIIENHRKTTRLPMITIIPDPRSTP